MESEIFEQLYQKNISLQQILQKVGSKESIFGYRSEFKGSRDRVK